MASWGLAWGSSWGDSWGSPLDVTPTATISGSAVGGLTESEVVAGGETLIITLSGDTWVSAGATFNAQRQNIINGIDGSGAESTGWNAVVRDALSVSSVVRTSDTVVTVTLEAAPTFDIETSETVKVTVPSTAVTGGQALVATPTFSVFADAALVFLNTAYQHNDTSLQHQDSSMRHKRLTLWHRGGRS